MDATSRAAAWGQLAASIDMLRNAIRACPAALWGDRTHRPEYWYVAYHTLFFLDYYFSEAGEAFRPPAPFGLEELDPAGVLPPRVYTQEELLAYLDHGRSQARFLIEGLTEARAQAPRKLGARTAGTLEELVLYVMRHVQHHAAQLNVILRQQVDSAPGWVARST
jgi:DinB family protein